ncbi:energy transducer TonB family protein [Marinobacter mobilis]|uniref:Protein TonB n=1 Tax=Marinobacter mobilis TaxID=488533 RepID=A0A1H3A6S8_9GAMM|nr:energy transducer TonB [Marinobacter mobilis]SDX24884.1 protein TonB [Marinobacter mobilis]
MTAPGSQQPLPASYRIAVAVPLALLIHVIIFIVAGLDPVADEPEPDLIRVTLSRVGDVASPASTQLTADALVIPAPELPARTNAPEVITSEDSPRPGFRPRDITPEPIQPEPQPMPAVATPAIEQAATAEDSEGERGQTDNIEEITQISEPAQETSYIDLLAARIVRYATPYFADTGRAELTGVMAVEVELQLMNNGALIGASITQPSGDVILDRAAYRGALGASPYPEPPAGNKEGNRFRVTIKFAPERI